MNQATATVTLAGHPEGGTATAPAGPARVHSAATQRMLQGPMLSTLLRLAAPNVLGLFANTLVIGFDGYIVGRLGPEALAGVAMVLPVAMLMLQMSAGGLGGSTTALVARALGAGDPQEATRIARHALLVGLAGSLLFTLVFSGPWPYALFGASDGVLALAARYAGVLFPGAVAIWSVNVLASVARGTGQMGAAAGALIGTTAMHLLLCPVLALGAGPVPPLGVAGAALSTVVCNGISALVLLAWLSRRASPVRVLGTRWQLHRASFRAVLRLALPSATNPLLNNASIALTTAFIGTFGSVAVAAYGIAARLEYILVPIAFGVGSALTAMVATNLGAAQAARAKRVTWAGAGLVCAITSAIGLWAALWPTAWMSLATQDAAVVAWGSAYLRTVGTCYGFFGLGLALFFASQGAGRLMWPLTATTTRLLVTALGGTLALRLHMAPESIFTVVALSLAAMGTTLGVATWSSDWSAGKPRRVG